MSYPCRALKEFKFIYRLKKQILQVSVSTQPAEFAFSTCTYHQFQMNHRVGSYNTIVLKKSTADIVHYFHEKKKLVSMSFEFHVHTCHSLTRRLELVVFSKEKSRVKIASRKNQAEGFFFF